MIAYAEEHGFGEKKINFRLQRLADFAASAIGVHLFRLYTVISAELLKFPKVSFRLSFPKM